MPGTRSILDDSPLRVDGVAKVTGRARYTADVRRPGMLHARLVRSPYAHARILGIDATAASQAPGIHAVLTGADLPAGLLIGRRIHDLPLLATDVVRYVGEPVAAVAGERLEDVEAALDLVDVTYEPLPPLLTPDQATAPDAAPVHPDFRSYRGAPQDLPTNVTSVVRMGSGDVDAAFEGAEVVVDETFTTPLVHQAYGEPHAVFAHFLTGEDGPRLDVWATHKQPFSLRDLLADLLDLPRDCVHVQPAPIGGDFGGKGSPFDAPLAAMLSRQTGRPVRMVMTQPEELAAANPRHPSTIRLRTALSRDGRLLARDAAITLDSGAYAAHRPQPTGNLSGISKGGGAYRVPATRIVSRMVYTHHVPCGHMRAPGSVQTLFAVESHVDSCAAAVGLDPAEFRERNVLHEDDVSPVGEHWEHVIAPEVLRRAREKADAWRGERRPGHGAGLAFGMYGTGVGTSGAILRANADGTFVLGTGTPDQGAGSHTILALVAARELRVPFERVKVEPLGTDRAPTDSGSGASRVTHVAGTAAQQTASALRQQLAEAAAEALGCPVDQLEQDDTGAFFDPTNGTARRLGLTEVVAEARALAGLADDEPLAVQREFTPAGRPEQESFAGCVVEVEVDRSTGLVQPRRIAVFADIGTVLFPVGARGQIEGSVAQGLGFALREQCPIDASGQVATWNLNDYKISAATDVPEIEVEFVEGSTGPGPFGAKAVGELLIGLVAPAVANAVQDAVGVRIRDLPITAERLYRALQGK